MSETMLAVGIAAAILAGMFLWVLVLDVMCPACGRLVRRAGARRPAARGVGGENRRTAE